MSDKKYDSLEMYYKLRKEELNDEFDQNHLWLIQSVSTLLLDNKHVSINNPLVSKKFNMYSTFGIDSYLKFQSIKEDEEYFPIDSFSVITDAGAKKILENRASKSIEETLHKAGRRKKNKALNQKKNEIDKLQIYNTVKIIDGVKTQIGKEYDIKKYIIEQDNAGERFEYAMAGIRLGDEIRKDMYVNVFSNALAIAGDMHPKSNGKYGGVVRASIIESALAVDSGVLHADEQMLAKDIVYTSLRLSNTYTRNDPVADDIKMALSTAYDPLDNLKREKNIPDKEFWNIVTVFAQNTKVYDKDKQVDRVKYLGFLIDKYPNDDYGELAKTAIDLVDPIEKSYKYDNSAVDFNEHAPMIFKNISFYDATKTNKKLTKDEHAKKILYESVEEKKAHKLLQTGDDLRAEKKYRRNLEQQRVADTISYDTALKEKHYVKNIELKQKRVITSQEFEWMYQEILRRLLNDLKIGQFAQ